MLVAKDSRLINEFAWREASVRHDLPYANCFFLARDLEDYRRLRGASSWLGMDERDLGRLRACRR